jgi:hypothetical protein
LNAEEHLTEDAKKLQQMDLDSLILYIEQSSGANGIKKGVKTTQKKTTTKVS